MLVDESEYGFLRDEMDTKTPASEAFSDDNILTPSTLESADVAEIEEPVQEPIPACSIQPVVPGSKQPLHPRLVQGSTHARFPASSTSAPTPAVIQEDYPDSSEAKEDVLGEYKERCNLMSSRIDYLEQENRQLQIRFVTEQTLNTRTTLSLHAKEIDLCMVQEAFWKLWEAHRRQLNSGLEAHGTIFLVMNNNLKACLGLRYIAIAGFRLCDYRNELVPSSGQIAFANRSAFPGRREAFGVLSQSQKLSQEGKKFIGHLPTLIDRF
ncbi:hypothetical protein K4K52_002371 [Colletotrichum sp. SAR 10_76]|nr:hypothetical protein K4K52_002371 [Colletotrichum sp. SAR 10_76]